MTPAQADVPEEDDVMDTAEETEQPPTAGDAPDGPRIEVLGDASAEQVAALVAVLSGLGGTEEEPAASTSLWASRERLLRAPVLPSPGAWRASGLPR